MTSIHNTTTTDHPSTTQTPTNVISNVILSHLKDQRYIQIVQNIIKDLPINYHNESTNNNNNNQRILSWMPLLSSVIYFLLMNVTFSNGITLGSQYVGLESYQDPHHRGEKAWKRVSKLVFQILVSYIMFRPPDVIESSIPRQVRDARGVGESDTRISQREQLRGSARREIFLEQRRRLAERASRQINAPVQSPSVREDVTIDDYSTLTSFQKIRRTIFERFSPIGTLRWVIRMQIALYLIKGDYRMRKSDKMGKQKSLRQASQPSYDSIGYLIFLEGLASILSMSSIASVDILMYFKGQMNKMFKFISKGGNHTGSSLLSEVERKVPSVHSHHSTSKCQVVSRPCSICMNFKKFPSATPCGHVFCWDCIINWTMNVRKECPLCRRPCREQDVIFLKRFNKK